VKPIAIEFAPATPRALLARLPRTAWLLLLAGLICLLLAGAELSSLRLELAAVEADVERLVPVVAARSSQPRRAPAVALTPTTVAAINVAILQLNIPWDELLDTLERANHPHVALLEVVPEPSSRRLRGVAEARNKKDMLEYIEGLKAQPMFPVVILTSHQLNEQDSNHPVRFEFMLNWQEVQP